MKKEVKKPKFKPSKTRLDMSYFPLRVDNEPRVVFFARLHDEDKKELIKRGYRPRFLFDLPRGEPQQEVEYLLAKAQAMEEGTVAGDELTEKLLKLQMLANRMIGTKNTVTRVNVSVDKTDVAALLASWGSSRHTLGGNTTIQEAQQLKEDPAKGKKK